ncbi:MAG TPA: alginate export family protein [Verrucomicrobiota bacterium]|nr:alginate export family protein [Verrucomicrobiota bacterium]HRZ35825.1 alginate export family protein [Candidatus Paceibacterota bacterium]HRZ54473.1 alginate export family protein [Candidatus Paceibacterota bacterium]
MAQWAKPTLIRGKHADSRIGRPPGGCVGSLAWLTLAALASMAADSAVPTAKPWYSPLKDIEVGPGKLDFGLNVRTRYEYLDNFSILHYGTGAEDDVLLLRTRLNADYRFTEQAHTFVEFQDARYWLSDLALSDFGESCSYYDEFDLRQAYLEWKHMGKSAFGVKLGRQILLYGDRRLFAPAEWGNVGNYWWDSAKLYYDTDTFQVDAFYAQRVLSEPKDWNFDHWPYHVGGVYAHVKQLPVTLDAFYVVKHDWSGSTRGESGTGDETRHTFGLFSEQPAGKGWDYGLFAAGQVGQYGRDDIEAFGVIARGGHTFKTDWKPRVGFEFNYASGDRDPNDGVAGTFDGVFGAMDTPYGWMNVVSWKNLEDYALNFSVQPAKTVKLGVDYHYFRLSQSRDAWYWVNGKPERRDPAGQAGQDLGHELDVILRWQINNELELLFGYARFLAGDFVRNTPGNGQDANWAFAQLTYNF